MKTTSNLKLTEQNHKLCEVLIEIINAGWRHDRDSETLDKRKVAHQHGRQVLRQLDQGGF